MTNRRFANECSVRFGQGYCTRGALPRTSRIGSTISYSISMPRILVAEDEKKLATFIRKALNEAGHAVEVVHDGNEALDLASHTHFDGIVLDIMLPGRDGLSVLTLLRERRVETPVLILTARGEVSERIAGLESGADDYMSKPFAVRELVARVNAVTRRSAIVRSTLLKVGDLTMNVLTREVRRGENKVELALREFSLLEYLMRAPGEVHSRTSLCERVWDYHFDTGTNLVDVYIKRLRRKMDEGYPVKLIHTVRGVGYMIKEP